MKASTIKTAFLLAGIDHETTEKFLDWLMQNREIWETFENYALKASRSGKKIGAKCIAELIRWDTEIEKNGEYKLNNNYPAYMARLFMLKHKNEYFQTRIIKGLAA